MHDVLVLGPQFRSPNLREALEQAALHGPIASITAGWQEREGELGALEEHLGVPVRDLRLYERAEVLFLEDAPCAGLHIVQGGCIKLYRLSPAGRQYIVRLCMEGDTFNEVSVFDSQGNPVNAEAIEPSRLWVIEPDSIRAMVARDPNFGPHSFRTR